MPGIVKVSTFGILIPSQDLYWGYTDMSVCCAQVEYPRSSEDGDKKYREVYESQNDPNTYEYTHIKLSDGYI